MKLLICTQAVDSEDPVLGFFVRWIEEFAKHCEKVTVICLRVGRHTLPSNVSVHSLGKEARKSNRLTYSYRFLRLVWRLRHDYDAVFVHMNQEYVLLAGWLWKAMGKRVSLWRNHYAGSVLTDVATLFCDKVFCTSKHSYTAKYKKTTLMPVGVDTTRFFPDQSVVRKPHSILFLARMSPSKRPDMLVDALAELARQKQDFSASFVGSPLPQDEAYYEELKRKVTSYGLGGKVVFLPAIQNNQTVDLYRAHEIFVNTSPSGMFDKTLFEAAACGCIVLASSADLERLVGAEYSFDGVSSLAERLSDYMKSPQVGGSRALETTVTSQSLTVLAGRILAEV